MTPKFVHLSHHVEKERFDVIEKRFMVKKHFRQQTKILTINLRKQYNEREGRVRGMVENKLYFADHPLRIWIQSRRDRFRPLGDVEIYTSSKQRFIFCVLHYDNEE